MVRAYHLMVDHFFDDYFAVVRPGESQASLFCLQEAFKLIGLVLDDEKSQPPSDFAMVLGVAFNTRALKDQRLLLVEPKPTRVANLTSLINKILDDDFLSPSLAASLLGKFGFLCSTMFGKVGRCCTQSIRARQYGNPDEVTLTRNIRVSLHLMHLFTNTAPCRELPLDHQLPPLILYTDASTLDCWRRAHRSSYHADFLYIMDRSTFDHSLVPSEGDVHGSAGDSSMPHRP
jgi:hypothetical protein